MTFHNLLFMFLLFTWIYVLKFHFLLSQYIYVNLKVQGPYDGKGVQRKSYFELKSRNYPTSVVKQLGCPFCGKFCKRYCWIFWSSKYFAGLTLIPKLQLGNILHEITVEIQIEFSPTLFIPCPSDGASCCGRHLIGLRKKWTEPVITNRAEKNIWCPPTSAIDRIQWKSTEKHWIRFSAWFCLTKGQKYIEQLRQIQVTA